MQHYQRRGDDPAIIIGVAAALSVALSLLANILDPWVNNDGSLYLRMAQDFAGLDAGEVSYEQPFYAWLIHLVAGVTGLAFKHAAWGINALLNGVLCVYFIRLCVYLRPGRDSALIAAAVLLLYPPLNEYRAFIVRDFGLWALSVAGLYHFVRAWENNALGAYTAAAVAFAGAALFRVEAALLLVLPVWFGAGALGMSWKSRLALLPLGLALAALLYLVPAVSAVVDNYVARLAFSWHGYEALAELYADRVMHGFLEEYALWGLWVSLVTIFLTAMVAKLHFVYLIALGWLLWRRRGLPLPQRLPPVLLFFLWASLFTLVYFLFVRVLQGRHFILLLLPWLLVLALALVERLQQRGLTLGTLGRRRALWWGLLAALLFVDGFISFGADESHLRQVAAWSRQHLQSGQRVLVNAPSVAYEIPGRKTWSDINVLQERPDAFERYLDDYDTVVLEASRKGGYWQETIDGLESKGWRVRRFKNNKGDIIAIVQRTDGSDEPRERE